MEKIQFWGVLLWMLGMLVMAAFAVREVWLDVEKPGEEAGAEGRSTEMPREDKKSVTGEGGAGNEYRQ